MKRFFFYSSGILLLALGAVSLEASRILGVGTSALIGNDLTDLGNNGNEADYNPPGDLGGFDAVFSSSDEPGFEGGEFAFNVFDNKIGPSNNKWCCGTVSFPQWVQAEFSQPIILRRFTLASGNDSPSRDPDEWQILGSNDGVNFVPIYTYTNPGVSPWTERNQVIQWSEGEDFPAPQAYWFIRFSASSTGETVGAIFQLNEFEIFGDIGAFCPPAGPFTSEFDLNVHGNGGRVSWGGSLKEGSTAFTDRSHQYVGVPEELLGARYLQVANNDKTADNFSIQLNLIRPTTVYLILDNRIGDGIGGVDPWSGLDDPPSLGNSEMDWVLGMRFEDTGLDIGYDESADGDLDQTSSIYRLEWPGGPICLGASRHGGNHYGVVLVPSANTQPGWRVRQLDLTWNDAHLLDTLSKAEQALEGTLALGPDAIEFDRAQVYDVVDLAGNTGTFSVDHPYPSGSGGQGAENFVIEATARVLIPPGDWSIAFGSDDGGSLTIPGVTFLSKFNEAGPASAADEVRFEYPRAHGWTGGHFHTDQTIRTTLRAVMYELGIGDSLEIAIRNNSDMANQTDPSPGNGWNLLKDGLLGWRIISTPSPQVYVSGRGKMGVSSFQKVGEVERENVVSTPIGDLVPGLVQEWYDFGNLESIQPIRGRLAWELPVIPPFNASGGTTWWSGNQSDGSGTVPHYPANIVGAARPSGVGGGVFNDLDNDQYTVRLTGEIFLVKDDHLFKDGVDDFLYMAIDLDGDGVMEPDEVIINDNHWTTFDGSENGGSPIWDSFFNYASLVSFLPDEGTWRQIEVIMSEGGGGDAGVLYRANYVDNWPFFPLLRDQPSGIQLLLGNDALRGQATQIDHADLVARFGNNRVWEFDLDGSTGESDRVVVENGAPAQFTTIANLVGAHFRFNAKNVQSGQTFQIIEADEIIGIPSLPIDWVFNPETGEVTYENKTPNTSVLANFDAPGVPYTMQRQRGTYDPTIQPGGASGQYLRLMEASGRTQSNLIAFNKAASWVDTMPIVDIEFDIRISNDTEIQSGQGGSLMLVSSEQFGNSGGVDLGFVYYRPHSNGVFGLGFEYWEDSRVFINTVSLYWNRSVVARSEIDPLTMDWLEKNFHRVKLRLEEKNGKIYARVSLTPDFYGGIRVSFDPFGGAVEIPGMEWFSYRVAIGSSSLTGYTSDFDVDNVTLKLPQGVEEETLSQAILFNELEDLTLGAEPFYLEANATSGLPVSYEIVSGPATWEPVVGLAAASTDGSLEIWDPTSGELLRSWKGHLNYVSSVAFSPDGSILASGSYDGTIKLWNTTTGGLIRTIVGHSDWVLSVSFSPDGATLASGSRDKTIKLWNTMTGSLIRTLEGHSNWVSSLAFGLDGITLVSGSWDHTIKIWNPAVSEFVTSNRDSITLRGGGAGPGGGSP